MLDNGYHLPSYIEAGDRIVVPGRPTPVNGAGNGAVAGPSKLPSEDKVDVRPLKEGWVETPEANGPPVDGRWPVLSMDCEMVCIVVSRWSGARRCVALAGLISQVLTADGQQLARVSIIDYHTGLVVLDELVQPASPVTDYRTQYVTPCPSCNVKEADSTDGLA
jgi:RNA exonuclease 1